MDSQLDKQSDSNADSLASIQSKVADYYSKKLEDFGATPQGVDWNSEQSQTTRFGQLSKVLMSKSKFSINDLGCGYGAFLDYLESTGAEEFNYKGYDLSSSMIKAARERDRNSSHQFVEGSSLSQADYSVASGIFIVRLDVPDSEWRSFIFSTLSEMDKYSNSGFAFNMLTSYSDAEKMRPYLFYANPCQMFDYCKTRFSKQVALLHDYGLYEFTIIVRKE